MALECPMGIQESACSKLGSSFSSPKLASLLCSLSRLVTFNHGSQTIHPVTQVGSLEPLASCHAFRPLARHTCHTKQHVYIQRATNTISSDSQVRLVSDPSSSLPAPLSSGPLEQGHMHWPLQVLGPPAVSHLPSGEGKILDSTCTQIPFLLFFPWGSPALPVRLP